MKAMEREPVTDDHKNREECSLVKGLPDAALCTLLLIVLLVVLAVLSTMQSDSGQVGRSRFSGGMIRPALHLECTVPEFENTTSDALATLRACYAGQPYVAVHLFSPLLEKSVDDVPGHVGGADSPGQTMGQRQDLSLYQFMQLAPGIDPGVFQAGGQRTALLIPSMIDRQLVYEPQAASGYRVDADQELTRRLLKAVWPIYGNPVLAGQRPEDFSHARTRIYVETTTVAGADGDEHYVVIGHLSYRFPDALNDGSLAWLAGFSSGLTEIVYLGETWSDPVHRTNKRIDFLLENGYPACANAYADYAFPGETGAAVRAMQEKLLKAGYDRGDADRQARDAVAQIRLSEALLDGSLEKYASTLYPPFLAYPDAWAAYIAHCEKERPEPPQWFHRLFLNRLGFD